MALKFIFRSIYDVRNACYISYNILRRHNELKHRVALFNNPGRKYAISVPWLPMITFLGAIKLKSSNNTKDGSLGTLLAETDDLFNENKYEEVYDLLSPYKESTDVEVLWRISRVLYNMSKLERNNEEKKRLIFEGYALIEKALQLDDKHYAVHKWYSIFLDARAAYDGIKARVTQLPNVKQHMLKAIELNPKDATTLHMLGFWCYNISAMPWYQRKIASAIFAAPPTSSFEEALSYFSKAEETDPNFYSQNLLMLGKTYLQLNKEEKARYYLTLTSLYPARTDEDLQAKKEACELLKNIEKKK